MMALQLSRYSISISSVGIFFSTVHQLLPVPHFSISSVTLLSVALFAVCSLFFCCTPPNFHAIVHCSCFQRLLHSLILILFLQLDVCLPPPDCLLHAHFLKCPHLLQFPHRLLLLHVPHCSCASSKFVIFLPSLQTCQPHASHLQLIHSASCPLSSIFPSSCGIFFCKHCLYNGTWFSFLRVSLRALGLGRCCIRAFHDPRLHTTVPHTNNFHISRVRRNQPPDAPSTK